mmetsp:Transcript_10472/g.26627  ORF Transcript_10472/g.26627 Transcript_10472/m.26627 type:complete len:214 (+) Transcript_10472:821-1462(+)
MGSALHWGGCFHCAAESGRFGGAGNACNALHRHVHGWIPLVSVSLRTVWFRVHEACQDFVGTWLVAEVPKPVQLRPLFPRRPHRGNDGADALQHDVCCARFQERCPSAGIGQAGHADRHTCRGARAGLRGDAHLSVCRGADPARGGECAALVSRCPHSGHPLQRNLVPGQAAAAWDFVLCGQRRTSDWFLGVQQHQPATGLVYPSSWHGTHCL